MAILFFLAIRIGLGLGDIRTRTPKAIGILLVYALLVTPLVEWPGTVVKLGLPEFFKAVVFFIFTVAFVRTVTQLRVFVTVIVACMALRVLEPLYLNLTVGYFGSAASMEGGAEFLVRLSGGPYDTINPNGLAFVICLLLTFLYFLSSLSVWTRLAFFLMAPLSLYAFTLTGSRSGLIGLAGVFAAILVKSRRKTLVGAVMAVALLAALSTVGPDMRDRYLSTIGKGERNAATANERVEGMRAQMEVALRRPLLGHGLGTSREANSHFTTTGPYAGRRMPAHNLVLEVWQELGLIGLFVFGNLLFSIFQDSRGAGRALLLDVDSSQHSFLLALHSAIQTCLFLNVLAGLSSYGLASYEWYLLGGLSLAIRRLVLTSKSIEKRAPSRPPVLRGSGRFASLPSSTTST